MEKIDVDRMLDRMSANWPSEIIARKKVDEFMGHMITGKSVANFEALGDGPPKIKIGRLAGYPKQAFIDWLRPRIAIVHPNAD